ncbi:MAG: AraC family transcriptional regulator, partial [Bacteroidota bacterium]
QKSDCNPQALNFILDISQPFAPQFREVFQMEADQIHPSLGRGEMRYQIFPGSLEFYSFHPWQIYPAYSLTSVNPKEKQCYAVHINLGTSVQEKKVGDQVIQFQRPAGILLYCPGLEISTDFEAGDSFELASFRFPRSFLEDYFGESIIPADKQIMYEALTPRLEQKIRRAISSLPDRLKCHSLLLEILHLLLHKFRAHEQFKGESKLHSQDVKNLLEISQSLSNPKTGALPSVADLAQQAHMSLTKFKTAFKELFGCAPLQYHRKIKLEYAREALQSGRKSPQELSFELGYSHPSNFTTAYKNYFQKLPSEEIEDQ